MPHRFQFRQGKLYFAGGRGGLLSLEDASVDLAPMSDADHVDHDLGSVHFVNDAIVADSNPVGVLPSAKPAGPQWRRVLGESIDRRFDATADGGG